MAVQYDKNDGWSNWIDLFKKNVVEVSNEINGLFDLINNGKIDYSKVKNWEKLFDKKGITESREELKEFFTTAYQGGEVSAKYQQWMIANGKATSTFASITSKAKNILKSFGASLASMAINMVIGMVIQGVIQIIDKAITTTEEYKEKLSDLKSELSDVESELDSLKDELSDINDRMRELESKDTLTFTEKEEYDNLVKQNNELQRRIDLLELEANAKKKALNKTFVDTMNSDTEDEDSEYVNQKFKEREKNLLRIAELEEQLKSDIDNKRLKDEKARLELYNEKIDSYLQGKSKEWYENANEISYIQNPTTEDEKAVNAWLDYIADFQDKMAIAMDGTNAKTNTFNRLVDSEQFNSVTKELQDLGNQGKVTADMLDNSKYDTFIQKLVALGVIDTADNLEDVALTFNNIASSADKASDSTSRYKNEVASLETLNKNINDAFDSISKSYDVVQEFKDAMSNGMTESALDSVAGLSDELKAMVAEFHAGTVSADELFNALTEHYENDLENYSEALFAKNKNNV